MSQHKIKDRPNHLLGYLPTDDELIVRAHENFGKDEPKSDPVEDAIQSEREPQHPYQEELDKGGEG